MEPGTFSISLTVKDLSTSRQFSEKPGFSVFHGDPSQNWLIMKNGDHVIGLFQGMFDKNILTFNPGWDSNAQKLAAFTDVRELQRRLKSSGGSDHQQGRRNYYWPRQFRRHRPRRESDPVRPTRLITALGWRNVIFRIDREIICDQDILNAGMNESFGETLDVCLPSCCGRGVSPVVFSPSPLRAFRYGYL
jgi:hypothetical protein